MHLTESDKRLLARVRHAHRVWRWLRWVMLCFWLLGAALSFLFLVRQIRLASEGDAPATGFLIAWSGFYWGAFWICLVFAAYEVGRWNNPMRELLLRLAEEDEKKNL